MDDDRTAANLAMKALQAALLASDTSKQSLEQAVELAAYVRNALAAQSARIGQVLARVRGEDGDAFFNAQRDKYRAAHPNLFVAEIWGTVPEWLAAMRAGPTRDDE